MPLNVHYIGVSLVVHVVGLFFVSFLLVTIAKSAFHENGLKGEPSQLMCKYGILKYGTSH